MVGARGWGASTGAREVEGDREVEGEREVETDVVEGDEAGLEVEEGLGVPIGACLTETLVEGGCEAWGVEGEGEEVVVKS